VVITVSPGPFMTSWRDSVDAIVDFGFPGEQVSATFAPLN
jgi:hypothetical protein